MDANEQQVAEILAMQKGAPKGGSTPESMQSAVPPEVNSVRGRPFEPGECPNPAGRPSLSSELAALIAEIEPVSGKRKTRLLAESLYTIAMRGSVQAHMLIMDRTEGKQVQPVDLTVRDMTDAAISDELAQLEAEHRAYLARGNGSRKAVSARRATSGDKAEG